MGPDQAIATMAGQAASNKDYANKTGLGFRQTCASALQGCIQASVMAGPVPDACVAEISTCTFDAFKAASADPVAFAQNYPGVAGGPGQASDCLSGCFAQPTGCAFACRYRPNPNTGASCLAPSQASVENWRDAIMEWEQKFVDYMAGVKAEADAARFTYWAHRSADDLLRDGTKGDAPLIAGGYIGMLVFAAISLTRPGDCVRSLCCARTTGVLMVMLTVWATLGIVCMIGPTYYTTIQVLPFLSLGLGVDDIFVLATTFWFRTDPQKSLSDMTREAGARVTLTSAVNFVSFMVGSAVPSPAVASLSQAAAIAVALNWVMMYFGFTAVLAFNADRMKGEKNDFLWTHGKISPDRYAEDLNDPAAHAPRFSKLFAKFLYSPAIVALSLMTVIALMVAAGVGAKKLELGLPFTDIVPEDHYSKVLV
eukprot:g46109.t1